MSKHREPAVKFAPSKCNVAQLTPEQFPQPHWYAEAERLRASHEHADDETTAAPALRTKSPSEQGEFILPDRKDVAMQFPEIAVAIGCTPERTRQIFNEAMRKLARMRHTKPMRSLEELLQWQRQLRDQRSVTE